MMEDYERQNDLQGMNGQSSGDGQTSASQNYGRSDYSEPTYSQPDYSEPTYSQPTYSEPTYSQQNYSQQSYHQQYYSSGSPKKSAGNGFGIAAMVLGILSIFLFGCCVNYITAVLAIIFAIIQIVRSESKGFAIVGIVTACVSIVLATAMWIGLSLAVGKGGMDEFYKDPYQFFEDKGIYDKLLEEYNSEL